MLQLKVDIYGKKYSNSTNNIQMGMQIAEMWDWQEQERNGTDNTQKGKYHSRKLTNECLQKPVIL